MSGSVEDGLMETLMFYTGRVVMAPHETTLSNATEGNATTNFWADRSLTTHGAPRSSWTSSARMVSAEITNDGAKSCSGRTVIIAKC